MEQAPKVEETSSGTSALDDGLGAAVIGCIGHDGDCCKDRDAEKIDAARYRWLKRQPWVKTKGIHAWGALLDNAIDEARHDAPNVERNRRGKSAAFGASALTGGLERSEGEAMHKPIKPGCIGHDCDDCKKQKREMRNLKTNLKALTEHVMRHLVWLDEEMKKPESPARGKRMATLANALEVANDAARYHGLGVDFRKDNKDKERERVMRSNVELRGGPAVSSPERPA